MVSIGSNATVVHGPNALFSIGSNAYASVENWQLQWSYKILKEAVSNSQIPLYAASTFDGNFTADAILTTDNNWLGSYLTISNGDLTPAAFTLLYKDVTGSTVTTTCSGRFHELTQKQSKNEFVRYSVKCELNAVPTGF